VGRKDGRLIGQRVSEAACGAELGAGQLVDPRGIDQVGPPDTAAEQGTAGEHSRWLVRLRCVGDDVGKVGVGVARGHQHLHGQAARLQAASPLTATRSKLTGSAAFTV